MSSPFWICRNVKYMKNNVNDKPPKFWMLKRTKGRKRKNTSAGIKTTNRIPRYMEISHKIKDQWNEGTDHRIYSTAQKCIHITHFIVYRNVCTYSNISTLLHLFIRLFVSLFVFVPAVLPLRTCTSPAVLWVIYLKSFVCHHLFIFFICLFIYLSINLFTYLFI